MELTEEKILLKDIKEFTNHIRKVNDRPISHQTANSLRKQSIFTKKVNAEEKAYDDRNKPTRDAFLPM